MGRQGEAEMETQQELSKQSFPGSAPNDIFQGKDEEGQADLREDTCAIPAFKGKRKKLLRRSKISRQETPV